MFTTCTYAVMLRGISSHHNLTLSKKIIIIMYNEFKFVGDFTSFYNSIQTEHLLLNFGLDSKLFYPLEKKTRN